MNTRSMVSRSNIAVFSTLCFVLSVLPPSMYLRSCDCNTSQIEKNCCVPVSETHACCCRVNEDDSSKGLKLACRFSCKCNSIDLYRDATVAPKLEWSKTTFDTVFWISWVPKQTRIPIGSYGPDCHKPPNPHNTRQALLGVWII